MTGSQATLRKPGALKGRRGDRTSILTPGAHLQPEGGRLHPKCQVTPTPSPEEKDGPGPATDGAQTVEWMAVSRRTLCQPCLRCPEYRAGCSDTTGGPSGPGALAEASPVAQSRDNNNS